MLKWTARTTLPPVTRADAEGASVWLFSKVVYLLVLLLLAMALLAIPVQAQPFAYVANRNSNSVSVIDTAINIVVATVGVGACPTGVAVTPDGTRAYVTNDCSSSVSVIDTVSNTVVATVGVGACPIGVAITPDGTRAYVSNCSGSVSVIDTTSNTVVATVGVAGCPFGVAITPDGTRAYVTNECGGVSVIATASNTVVAHVSVDPTEWVAITPDGTRAYVTVAFSGSVAVIDTASNSVVATVPVGSAIEVAITPDGTRAYVTNECSGVWVIDTASNTVVATVGVGGCSIGVAFTPDGTRAYVTVINTGSVSVILTTVNTVVATIGVGNGPYGVAITRGVVHNPGTLTLTPKTATNTVGATHCVTATVKDAFGNPVPNITVVFSVPTAVATHASPSTGSSTTNTNGETTFCYSASLPGADTIHAFADTNGNGQQDAGEPFDDATKTWMLPASTALCEVTITQGGWIVANNGDQANFGGNARVAADGSSVQGQENYQDQGPAQPMNVHSIQLTATTCSADLTTATIYGTATIDGSGMYVFRIDVIDQGDPVSNDAYGIILSNGYASGQHQLQGGNVTIHK